MTTALEPSATMTTAAPEAPSKREHGALAVMPQLDGVRALAIAIVFVAHFIPAVNRANYPWGMVGVRLFFVLSGFLITGILLRCRTFASERGMSRVGEMKRFYARRAIRIFPLFYLVL